MFVVCNSAKTQVKIRTEKPVADDQVRRVQTVNGYYGHMHSRLEIGSLFLLNRLRALPLAWAWRGNKVTVRAMYVGLRRDEESSMESTLDEEGTRWTKTL